MRSLAVRVIILALFVAAAGVSAYLFWNGELQARVEEEAGRRFDDRASTAARAMLDLRAAQQAYVAAGQDEQFWFGKVASSTAALKDTIETLRLEAVTDEGQTALAAASDAMQEFERTDRRARDHTAAGQKLLASDLVFSTGLGHAGTVINGFDQARAAEALARDEALRGVRRRQLFALGAAAAAAFLALLLLVPRPDDEVAPLSGTRDVERSTLGLVQEEGWTPARKALEAPRPAPAPVALPRTPPPTVDMEMVASVCTDLARIENTETLPSILERAAAALDASGIVLWISEPDGQELAPVLTHGYPQQVVARLARIPRDAENATAAAFRTALLQTVKADVVSDGAIAAPLLTHAGCVGVMAAEVRGNGEKDPAKKAAAAIVAAQISTLVGPPAARAQAAEAAGA